MRRGRHPLRVWSAGGTLCGTCGSAVRQDFVFCIACGTELDWRALPAQDGASMVHAKKVRGVRTRRGLAWAALGLILLWVPAGAVFGALFLSIGGHLVYTDRQPFGKKHASGTKIAYVLLWLVFLEYVLAFAVFFWQGYAAWLDNKRLQDITGDAQFFTLVTTAPTLLLTLALYLQVRHLVEAERPAEAGPKWRWGFPSGKRFPWGPQVLAAAILLTVLVLASTVFAYIEIGGGLGPGQIRIAAVLGILNRISFWRLIEAPGFLWFAYLYIRARASIKTDVAEPAPVAAGPAGNLG